MLQVLALLASWDAPLPLVAGHAPQLAGLLLLPLFSRRSLPLLIARILFRTLLSLFACALLLPTAFSRRLGALLAPRLRERSGLFLRLRAFPCLPLHGWRARTHRGARLPLSRAWPWLPPLTIPAQLFDG